MNKQLSWNHFVTWIFYGAVALAANRGVSILDKLESSVNDLNVKIAVVVMKTDVTEKRLDKQDDRILFLESKTGYRK